MENDTSTTMTIPILGLSKKLDGEGYQIVTKQKQGDQKRAKKQKEADKDMKTKVVNTKYFIISDADKEEESKDEQIKVAAKERSSEDSTQGKLHEITAKDTSTCVESVAPLLVHTDEPAEAKLLEGVVEESPKRQWR